SVLQGTFRARGRSGRKLPGNGRCRHPRACRIMPPFPTVPPHHPPIARTMLSLNARAARLCRELVEKAQEFRIAAADVQGTTVIDCVIEPPGGLEAGRQLAEICMGGLAQVWLAPGE